MRQLTMRVEDEVADAFYQFCERQHITPYELLGSIVGFYGRGEMLARKANQKAITQEEALIELGRIVADMQKLAKANGEFRKAVADLLEPHGIKLSNLWPSLNESGEKVPA